MLYYIRLQKLIDKHLYDITGFMWVPYDSSYTYLHICLFYTISAYRSASANIYMIQPASYGCPTTAVIRIYTYVYAILYMLTEAYRQTFI